MRNYKEVDVRFYDSEQGVEGDYIAGPDGDFALTEGYESAQQDMMSRIRTQKGDWRSHQWVGGDLELLEGEPNTRETGAKGASQIYETLTRDGRFDVIDIDVRAVPTSIESIEFFTILSTDSKAPVIVSEALSL